MIRTGKTRDKQLKVTSPWWLIECIVATFQVWERVASALQPAVVLGTFIGRGVNIVLWMSDQQPIDFRVLFVMVVIATQQRAWPDCDKDTLQFVRSRCVDTSPQ